MGSIVLDISLVLLGLASSLVAGVASQAAEGILDSASSRVDVGLESGGVVVVGRHFD